MLSPSISTKTAPEFAALAEQLVCQQLSPAQARELLLEVTPDRVSPLGFAAFVGVVRQALCADYAAFAQLSTYTFDCCGTGGSGLPHFNTSTTVAFVLAAAGVPVVKFGNRKATGQSGSFDLLAQLGFPAQTSPALADKIFQETGQVFLFAPACYPALVQLAAARQALGQRTIFNYIGPLLNPSLPARRLLGVSDAGMQNCIAHCLATDGITQKALVVRSAANMDELEPGIVNHIIAVEASQRSALEQTFEPVESVESVEQVTGNSIGNSIGTERAIDKLTPAQNKALFQQIISGHDGQSHHSTLVRLNAGAALYAAGKAATIEAGYEIACQLLKDGCVQQQFDKVRRAYARHS